MGYEKKEWIELKRNGIKFELVVRDQDFAKLETKKFTPKDFTKTIKDIGKRYGINSTMLESNKDFDDEMGFLKRAKLI